MTWLQVFPAVQRPLRRAPVPLLLLVACLSFLFCSPFAFAAKDEAECKDGVCTTGNGGGKGEVNEDLVDMFSKLEGSDHQLWKYLFNVISIEEFSTKYWEKNHLHCKRNNPTRFAHLVTEEHLDLMLDAGGSTFVLGQELTDEDARLVKRVKKGEEYWTGQLPTDAPIDALSARKAFSKGK